MLLAIIFLYFTLVILKSSALGIFHSLKKYWVHHRDFLVTWIISIDSYFTSKEKEADISKWDLSVHEAMINLLHVKSKDYEK